MADKDKAKIDLGLLEEDDEFEEFPAEGKFASLTYKLLNSKRFVLYRLDWHQRC